MKLEKREKLDKYSDEFGTPDDIFNELDRRYQFDWDACATAENSKCGNNFWDKEENALQRDWHGKRVWCNPPYSKMPGSNKGYVELFAMKAFRETAAGCPLVVLLVPTKTEQGFFGTLKNSGRCDFYYFNKRIQFKGGVGAARDSHMLIVVWPPLEFLQ